MNPKLIYEGEIGYKQCSVCTCDTTVPGIYFDKNDVCNFCILHEKMNLEYPNDEKGQGILEKLVVKIKKTGSNNKFDCVVGISGGRDSTFTLHYVKNVLKLNPLAVHFNDGFGNPIAGENMLKACKKLNVTLRTITSNWKESKDIKIALLKASVPDMELGTDLGIATALYGVAAKENIKYVLIGQSFRTEGIAPLSWNFLDGKYLKSVMEQFGTVKLKEWTPNEPGFNLGFKEMFYYSIIRGIKSVPILYYVDYVRKDVDDFLKKELDWENPGAHYFDDLYQALMTKVMREKFKIDRRKYNYAALVRSGQMAKTEALEKISKPYQIEDPKIIDLCIKRLGLSTDEFQSYISQSPKTFRDYKTNYQLIKLMRFPIYIASKLSFIPGSSYDKYFNCGE